MKMADEYASLLSLCKYLIDISYKVKHIRGYDKLRKHLERELKFLNKVSNQPPEALHTHCQCTNLRHYFAVLYAAVSLPTASELLKVFPVSLDECSLSKKSISNRIVVDVVLQGGAVWVKVVARNLKALHDLWLDSNVQHENGILRQAKLFSLCAAQNPFNFQVPQVYFCFYNGITRDIRNTVESMGIRVIGDTVDINTFQLHYSSSSKRDNLVSDVPNPQRSTGGFSSSQLESRSSDPRSLTPCDSTDLNNVVRFFFGKSLIVHHLSELSRTTSVALDLVDNCNQGRKVNLDITTLIAMVSALTNGAHTSKFKELAICEQAERELHHPLLPQLHSYLRGRQMIVCTTAWNHFIKIVDTVGGEAEKQRRDHLEKLLHIMDDGISDRVQDLPLTAHINQRAKAIFGFGDKNQLVTTTANNGFVRSSSQQGVQLNVFLHEARALAEVKIIHD